MIRNLLETIKEAIENIVPNKDGRTEALSPLMLVIYLIFHYVKDSKNSSIEMIRRNIKSDLGQDISPSTFWERLTTRRLNNFLKQIIDELMRILATKAGVDRDEILKTLNVTGIFLFDSTYIALIEKVKNIFPGTGSKSGIKFHACFNLLTGVLEFFQLTPGSTHDQKFSIDTSLLKGKLAIFDLGYFNFNFMYLIDFNKGFFLSRLKSNAVVTIVEVIKGFPKKALGESLLSVCPRFQQDGIVEAIIEKVCDHGLLRCRAIGFWNPIEKRYHWYLTNLAVAAYFIYPLYRLRWQIELIFKAWKQSFNADQISSGNKMIIENFMLISIAAQLFSTTVFLTGLQHLTLEKKYAASFQRAAKITVHLSRNFISFFLSQSHHALDELIDKIKLLSDELFDPNYRTRESSLARIGRLASI
jgi:hypothetical protein